MRLPLARRIKEEIMKRFAIVLGLLLGLSVGTAQAQTRVGVSLTFGDPYFAGQVVIGRPYYHRYARPYFYGYRPEPLIVVGPRYYYREPRVIVVRPHRYYARRYRRGW
jgi:hypothetical protein